MASCIKSSGHSQTVRFYLPFPERDNNGWHGENRSAEEKEE